MLLLKTKNKKIIQNRIKYLETLKQKNISSPLTELNKSVNFAKPIKKLLKLILLKKNISIVEDVLLL